MAVRDGLAAALGIVLSGLACADELLMKNGSRLVGTLISSSESVVVFDTPFAGKITIRQENIDEIITKRPVTLLMQDGTVYRDKEVITDEDKIFVLKDDQQPAVFAVTDINMINPEPWRLGEGYKWFGKINVAIDSERGNTDTDELDLSLESVWRSLEDRYTIRGFWEIDEANGDRNKNHWWIRNKYDRFSKTDPDNYYGFQVFFEHDQFADLDLRTAFGPYIGRQFFEGEYLTVHGEVGLVWVDEQFDQAEDDDYPGSNWEIRMSSGIIPKAELYVYQDGVWNLDETDDLIVNTTVGVRFPLVFGFTASAEALYEYDGGAVDEVDQTDETYAFKLGYSW
jgi:hypothetical protein